MQTLSTLTIVKDEQRWINHMLEFVFEYVKPDQAVIVDGGSSDDTLTIIKGWIERGAPIILIENPMPHSFSDQRNLALSHCSGNWVLHIDADETYSKNIAELITDIREGKYEDADGFLLATAHLIVDEQHMCDGGGDVHIRLFKNTDGIKYEGEIHEAISATGNILRFPEVALRHYSMLKSEEELLAKGKRWMQWEEETRAKGINIQGDNHFVDIVKNIKGTLYEVPREWE